MTAKAVRDEIGAIKRRAQGRSAVAAKLPMLQSEIERFLRERKEYDEEEEKDFLDLQTNPQREQERRELLAFMRAGVADDVQSIVGDAPIAEGSPEWNEIADRLLAIYEKEDRSRPSRAAEPKGETVSQAAEAWFSEMQRDPSAAVRPQTLDGHRLRVRAFVEHCGDIPLASV